MPTSSNVNVCGEYFLQALLPYLCVNERFRWGQLNRLSRSMVYTPFYEEKAMVESLRFSLGHLDADPKNLSRTVPMGCGSSDLSRLWWLSQKLTNWHMYGARFISVARKRAAAARALERRRLSRLTALQELEDEQGDPVLDDLAMRFTYYDTMKCRRKWDPEDRSLAPCTSLMNYDFNSLSDRILPLHDDHVCLNLTVIPVDRTPDSSAPLAAAKPDADDRSACVPPCLPLRASMPPNHHRAKLRRPPSHSASDPQLAPLPHPGTPPGQPYLRCIVRPDQEGFSTELGQTFKYLGEYLDNKNFYHDDIFVPFVIKALLNEPFWANELITKGYPMEMLFWAWGICSDATLFTGVKQLPSPVHYQFPDNPSALLASPRSTRQHSVQRYPRFEFHFAYKSSLRGLEPSQLAFTKRKPWEFHPWNFESIHDYICPEDEAQLRLNRKLCVQAHSHLCCSLLFDIQSRIHKLNSGSRRATHSRDLAISCFWDPSACMSTKLDAASV
eukprot:Gregarina_sp_Pseudo_9__2184@NODE_252_length_3415_cov_19_956161_g235_i0_p1_GENE_NODE_252_length_3415_cov_19_956161_g235_i0NODE_252_length_3415_cov_19_956161_g235_i0_p1_ORF_typecomplete_len500_score77_27_NODE_252_length_3415_cov_19_956161_g235_i012482747